MTVEQTYSSPQKTDLKKADVPLDVGSTLTPHETDPNSELNPLPPETEPISEATVGTPLKYQTPKMKEVPPVIGTSGKDDESNKSSEKLTLSEAAKQYGYKPHTLLQAIQRGALHGELGKIEIDAWFITREDLEAYIKSAKKKGKGPGTR